MGFGEDSDLSLHERDFLLLCGDLLLLVLNHHPERGEEKESSEDGGARFIGTAGL
jgi:hypothetical protein